MCTFVVQLGSYWIARKSPWFLIRQVIVIEKRLSSVFVQELDLTTYLQFKNVKKNRSNLNIMMHETSTIAWYSPPHIEKRLCLRRTCKFHGSRHDFYFLWTLALFDGLQDALWRAGRPASAVSVFKHKFWAGYDLIWFDRVYAAVDTCTCIGDQNRLQQVRTTMCSGWWCQSSILLNRNFLMEVATALVALNLSETCADLKAEENDRKCIIYNCIKGLSQPRFPQVAESVICYLHWHHFAVCTLQAWKNQPAVLDETLET